MRLRVPLVVFAAITILSVQPSIAPFPPATPGTTSPYERFLDGVRSRTPKDASIAVVVPVRRYEPEYAYHFYRASYVLAGREVLPTLSRENAILQENLQGADFVALWGARLDRSNRPQLWTEGPGQLLGR